MQIYRLHRRFLQIRYIDSTLPKKLAWWIMLLNRRHWGNFRSPCFVLAPCPKCSGGFANKVQTELEGNYHLPASMPVVDSCCKPLDWSQLKYILSVLAREIRLQHWCEYSVSEVVLFEFGTPGPEGFGPGGNKGEEGEGSHPEEVPGEEFKSGWHI